MAHRAADLALELGHAGFARVVGDDGLQRLHAQLALVFSQAVGLAVPFCSGGKLQRCSDPVSLRLWSNHSFTSSSSVIAFGRNVFVQLSICFQMTIYAHGLHLLWLAGIASERQAGHVPI